MTHVLSFTLFLQKCCQDWMKLGQKHIQVGKIQVSYGIPITTKRISLGHKDWKIQEKRSSKAIGEGVIWYFNSVGSEAYSFFKQLFLWSSKILWNSFRIATLDCLKRYCHRVFSFQMASVSCDLSYPWHLLDKFYWHFNCCSIICFNTCQWRIFGHVWQRLFKFISDKLNRLLLVWNQPWKLVQRSMGR